MPMIEPQEHAGAPQADCTCGSLRKASRRISQFYDAALSPVGIKSTQFAILSEVERLSKRRRSGGDDRLLTMCELAAAMVMDRSTLGHNLRPLEREELIVLQPASDDRRKRHVALTRKGKALLPRARQLWRRAENRVEHLFGKQPSADLRAVLTKIANTRDLNLRPRD